MKSIALLASCAALAHHVAAEGAYLYTIDNSVVSSSTGMIDSDLASAIIARRRALTDDRVLGITNEALLQDINTYGGYQAPLFADADGGKKETPGKLFIRITDVDLNINDLDAAMPDLWIQEPTQDLLTDFKHIPRRHRTEGICEYIVPPSMNTPGAYGVEVILSYHLDGDTLCLSPAEIPTLPITMSLHSFLPSKPKEVKSKLPGLIRILKHFCATENIESTVLFLPSKLAPSTKPSTDEHEHQHQARSVQSVEEPLDLPAATSAAPVIDDVTPTNASKNFTLPSVVPSCFSSKSACENTTNFCSGHGDCYKAHTNCFKCKCGTTLARVNEDGTKKTVQWGGAACEKKDVSVPFLLFASFGVLMAVLIAGAIGMLFKMGSEPLPSVIGAGVAGPKAGK
ncbi:hypothetical protein RBB50_009720 [Rhinocladiella similis]